MFQYFSSIFLFYGIVHSHSYLVSEYNLLEVECQSRLFLDTSSLDTQIGPLVYGGPCLHSNGASTLSSSRSSIPSAWHNLFDSAFSVEFWVQVNVTALLQPQVLVEFAPTVGSPFPPLRLGIGRSTLPTSKSKLQLSISICNAGLTQQTFLFSFPAPKVVSGRSVLQQLVVSFVYPSQTHVKVNVTVDGLTQKPLTGSSSFSASSGSYSPRYWPSGIQLYLLTGGVSNGAIASTSALTVYYLALHNSTLSTTEITTHAYTGVPNSLPFPLTSVVHVQENGEVGNHFHDPAFYQSPIPSSQLALLNLSVFDFDDQPVCPNFILNLLHPPSALVSSFPNPELCLLYREDGSEVNSMSPVVPSNTTTGTIKLRIRPAKNKFSPVLSNIPFCTFSFYALDGITGFQSLRLANVSVFVTPVDQPPVPVQNLTATAIPHSATSVELRGHSDSSSIMRWLILSLPSYGNLYTVSKHGIVSTSPLVLQTNATHGISINTSTTELVYIYTDTEEFRQLPSSDSSTGFLTADYFAFALVDALGRESVSAFFLLQVFSSITATTMGPTGRGSINTLTTQPLGIQGVCSPLVLYAEDKSNLRRNLTISILSGPSRGSLFSNSNCTGESPAIVTGFISAPYRAGAIVYYLSDPNFFSYPSLSLNGTSLNATLDSFTFQASTGDARSAVQTQLVSVQNFNHATDIRLNTSAFEPLVLRAYGAAPTSKDISVAAIFGFAISDPDRDTGLVRVRIATRGRGGVVSLNPAALDALDFNSAARCLGNPRWQCTGSGFEDRVAVFITYPSAALAALNGMNYRSTKPNIIDVVNITIYDGEGGECLDNSQQSDSSVRHGCFVRSVSFHVTVTGFAQTSPVGSSFGSFASLDARVQDVVITLLVLICLLCCRCCVVVRHRAAKLQQRLDRLDALEEGEKTRRGSHIRTTLDTDLDILPSQPLCVPGPSSTVVGSGSVDSLSDERKVRARQLLESSRSGVSEQRTPPQKQGDNRRLQTSPAIGNRSVSGESLFARVVAKDAKTFSSAVPPSPQVPATRRRSFRSEFEFRLKTEVLCGDIGVSAKALASDEEEAGEDYFTQLAKQLQESENQDTTN